MYSCYSSSQDQVKEKQQNSKDICFHWSRKFNNIFFKSLMRELNLRGRKRDILLCTIGQEKPVHSHILSDQGISRLESEDYIELPKMFTQKEIVVKQENIPQQ